MDERVLILEEAILCLEEAERMDSESTGRIIARRSERWDSILARGVNPYEAAIDAARYMFDMAKLIRERGAL